MNNSIELEDFTPGSIQTLVPTIKFGSLLMEMLARRGNLNMIKVLSPLLSNPNAPESKYLGTEDEFKRTPINCALTYGELEIIKFLAPLSDNLTVNVLQLAIDKARRFGYDNIVNYLNSIIESSK